jgi:ThiF family
MNDREFERRLRESTLAYAPQFREDERPVIVEVGEAAHSPAGHALTCALTNQLARTHRRLILVGDLECRLLCPDPFGRDELAAATAGLAREINPALEVEVVEHSPSTEAIARLGIGAGGDLSLGCRGWSALLATSGERAAVGEGASDIWGAMLASCLGAWFSFQRLLGEAPKPLPRYSLWNFGSPGDGHGGPALIGPLDVGRVLQVGAGGVGAALDYWLGVVGPGGKWTVVDGDVVEVKNLNRQLLFTAADAGYPDGAVANKAERVATRLGTGVSASAHWYGEEPAVVEADYDLVLALANERGAREALQDRRPDLLLHATTSANHQAQFHRHIRGLDDCIRCRVPGEVARLRCGGGRIAQSQSDAALPYLSGLAGLLLLAGLARVSVGELAGVTRDLALVDLGAATPTAQQLTVKCREGCRGSGAASVSSAD